MGISYIIMGKRNRKMTLIEAATFGTLIISAIALMRTIWDTRFKRLESDIKEIRSDLKEIREDISDVKERVAGIEMTTIFLQVNPTPPSRSEVAKKMWDRRKIKQSENPKIDKK